MMSWIYIDTAVRIWNDIFTDVSDRHAPLKKIRVKGIETLLISPQLNTAMQDPDFHYRKAIKTNSNILGTRTNKLKDT